MIILKHHQSKRKPLKGLKPMRTHAVHYSCYEWSGTWCDTCIEQKLMKVAKSEGGLTRGRIRNSDSGIKCWIQTLNLFSYINNWSIKNHGPVHKDLAKTWMKQGTEAIGLVL